MLRKRVLIRMAIPLWMGMLVASEGGNRGLDAQLEKKLEAAIHREIVLGDLGGAIELYREIVADAAPRVVAAKSLVQMGECLEKLGRNEEAYAKFRRVVSEYPDQTDELNRARLRLAAWS